jgi:Rho GTPase-activating protein 39
VWHKPSNCDIIPLAKLQILKQTTEPPVRDESSSNSLTKELPLQPPTIQQIQAQHQKMSQQHKRHSESNNNNGTNSSSNNNRTNSARRNHDSSERMGHSKQGFQIQQAKLRDLATSNSAAGNASDDFIVGESYKFCKHSGSGERGDDGALRNSQKYMDSGKSSDSSLSSVNYRKVQEGGSLRIGSTHGKINSNNKYNPESSYRMLQESSSAHNIPDRGNKLISSISNSSDTTISNKKKSPSHSTPLMKKRSQLDSQATLESKPRDHHPSKSKQHQSFDHPGPSTSVTRSGSFMSPVNVNEGSGGRIQQRKCSFEGYGSDDSMHEKYFKSVENTPITRRRHTTSSKMGLKSSDSSPQSPISPQHQQLKQKTVRPSHLGLESVVKNKKSSQKYDPDMVNMNNVAIKQDR